MDGAAGYSRSLNNYETLERGVANNEAVGLAVGDWVATRPSINSSEWSLRQTSGADWLNLGSFVSNTDNRAGGTRVSMDDRINITEIWSGQASARWALPFRLLPTVVKFGGKWNEENRKNNNYSDERVWSYNGPGGNTVALNPTTGAYFITSYGNWANVGPQFNSSTRFDMGTTNALTFYNPGGTQGLLPRASRTAMASLFREHPEQFVSTATPENFYTAEIANKRDFRQTISAGFLQADLRPTQKLQLRFGLRGEETKNASREFDPRLRNEVTAAGYAVNPIGTNGGRAITVDGLRYQFMSQPRTTRVSQYNNWFPSLLAKYQIIPNLEWQAGFNKAISRPPIDSLTGLWVVDENALRVSAPNADLQPEYSKNYQTRLAYYFSGRSPGQLSLAASQNDISNLRESFDFTSEQFGNDDPSLAAYTFRSTRNSQEHRRFRNLEFAYNQSLGFLPYESLRGLNFNVAYTRSYLNQRRSGVAPHRVSARLGYAFRRFNGALGMVWRDASPEGSIYGQIKGELTQFDLTLNWRLTSRLTLYTQGRNITNVPVIWYESPPGAKEGEQRHLQRLQQFGANWVFGLKGSF
jgi:iron complex outermembrane receptor protein